MAAYIAVVVEVTKASTLQVLLLVDGGVLVGLAKDAQPTALRHGHCDRDAEDSGSATVRSRWWRWNGQPRQERRPRFFCRCD
mmetsp:Transcript_51393/g.101851  ORF Transcript_51393/g.101851 Transcript_51393/m.101851 type:complete len:82 (-) Transcript_51393:251-496(-)